MLAVAKDGDDPYPIKPKTRADCAKISRPCPYVGCKHHLYLNVIRGRLKIVPKNDGYVADVLIAMEHTCSLDAADENRGMTLEEIGQIMEVSRERVRQVQNIALGKISNLVNKSGRGEYNEAVIRFFDMYRMLSKK